ncbi:cationic amino acid transporter [Trichonephila clavipes]|nr:cationic amino acid transporter [Trichonephila clavipes]
MEDHGSADANPSLPLDQPRRSIGSYGYLCDEDGGSALFAYNHHGSHCGLRHACARKQKRGSHLLPARLPVRHYLLFGSHLPTATNKVSHYPAVIFEFLA